MWHALHTYLHEMHYEDIVHLIYAWVCHMHGCAVCGVYKIFDSISWFVWAASKRLLIVFRGHAWLLVPYHIEHILYYMEIHIIFCCTNIDLQLLIEWFCAAHTLYLASFSIHCCWIGIRRIYSFLWLFLLLLLRSDDSMAILRNIIATRCIEAPKSHFVSALISILRMPCYDCAIRIPRNSSIDRK